MFGFKRSTKSKRKLTKSPAIQAHSSIDTKVLYNVPSVSQIAPLPENKSHGILPVLSLDGRDMPDIISSDDPSASTAEATDLPNGHQPVGEYLARSTFANCRSVINSCATESDVMEEAVTSVYC